MAKKISNDEEWKRLSELSDIHQDKASCGVIALASATGFTYKKAYDIFAGVGRKKRQGVSDAEITQAIKDSGYFPCHYHTNPLMKKYKYADTMTFNNAVKVLSKKKTYMLISKDHVATLRNGNVIDWTSGRKYKVAWVIELQGKECMDEKDKLAREHYFKQRGERL